MKERKKSWERLCNVGCRSFDSPPKMLPWLHHPSSFFNGDFESEGESNLWILPPYKAGYTPLLKPKQQLKTHKCAGNRKAAKTMQKPSARGTHGHAPQTHNRASLTTVRGEHYGPTMVSSSCRGFDTSWTLRFELLLVHRICLRSSCFGPIGLAFQLSLFGLASTHIFLLKLGPNHANLQS